MNKEDATLAHLSAHIARLRASHDKLLAAARRVVDTHDEASRRDGDARHAIRRLKAAVAAAEEPAQ